MMLLINSSNHPAAPRRRFSAMRRHLCAVTLCAVSSLLAPAARAEVVPLNPEPITGGLGALGPEGHAAVASGEKVYWYGPNNASGVWGVDLLLENLDIVPQLAAVSAPSRGIDQVFVLPSGTVIVAASGPDTSVVFSTSFTEPLQLLVGTNDACPKAGAGLVTQVDEVRVNESGWIVGRVVCDSSSTLLVELDSGEILLDYDPNDGTLVPGNGGTQGRLYGAMTDHWVTEGNALFVQADFSPLDAQQAGFSGMWRLLNGAWSLVGSTDGDTVFFNGSGRQPLDRSHVALRTWDGSALHVREVGGGDLTLAAAGDPLDTNTTILGIRTLAGGFVGVDGLHVEFLAYVNDGVQTTTALLAYSPLNGLEPVFMAGDAVGDELVADVVAARVGPTSLFMIVQFEGASDQALVISKGIDPPEVVHRGTLAFASPGNTTNDGEFPAFGYGGKVQVFDNLGDVLIVDSSTSTAFLRASVAPPGSIDASVSLRAEVAGEDITWGSNPRLDLTADLSQAYPASSGVVRYAFTPAVKELDEAALPSLCTAETSSLDIQGIDLIECTVGNPSEDLPDGVLTISTDVRLPGNTEAGVFTVDLYASATGTSVVTLERSYTFDVEAAAPFDLALSLRGDRENGCVQLRNTSAVESASVHLQVDTIDPPPLTELSNDADPETLQTVLSTDIPVGVVPAGASYCFSLQDGVYADAGEGPLGVRAVTFSIVRDDDTPLNDFDGSNDVVELAALGADLSLKAPRATERGGCWRLENLSPFPAIRVYVSWETQSDDSTLPAEQRPVMRDNFLVGDVEANGSLCIYENTPVDAWRAGEARQSHVDDPNRDNNWDNMVSIATGPDGRNRNCNAAPGEGWLLALVVLLFRRRRQPRGQPLG